MQVLLHKTHKLTKCIPIPYHVYPIPMLLLVVVTLLIYLYLHSHTEQRTTRHAEELVPAVRKMDYFSALPSRCTSGVYSAHSRCVHFCALVLLAV